MRRTKFMAMFILVPVFLLGVANFALHKAVLESGHPMIGRMPWFVHMLGGRGTLVVEFIVLLGAMLLVGTGSPAWGLGYLFYSLLNAIAGWIILTGRV